MKLEQCLKKLSPKGQKRLKENYKLENNSTLEELISEIISSLPEEIFIPLALIRLDSGRIG